VTSLDKPKRANHLCSLKLKQPVQMEQKGRALDLCASGGYARSSEMLVELWDSKTCEGQWESTGSPNSGWNIYKSVGEI